MEFATVRRIVAALLLSLPFVTAGEGEARAGDGAKEAAIRPSRAAWSVREARILDGERLRRLYSVKSASVKSAKPRKSDAGMGFSAFSRADGERKMTVFRYATPLSLGPGDFVLKVRAPGGKRSIMQIELEF